MALFIENFPKQTYNAYNPNDTDLTKGVIQEMTFIDNFANSNYDILTKSQYLAFTNSLDKKCQEVDNKVVLTEEEANELCKAIDDNNELIPITYESVSGDIVTVYVKPKINEELRKSMAEMNEVYEKSGEDIIKQIELKKIKIRKEADVYKSHMDYMFSHLPVGLTPKETTAASASKFFTNEYGEFAVFSYDECFPPNRALSQINNPIELQKARVAVENSSYCKQYNQAVHEYIGECTELMKLNDFVKSIDSEKTYKLNKQQLTAIFF